MQSLTYYDIAAFHKLQARLEDDHVNKVDGVSEEVKGEPDGDGLWRVVRESHACRNEPEVVIKGYGQNSQPGYVAAICGELKERKDIVIVKVREREKK